MDKVDRSLFCKEFHDALRHYAAKPIDLADLLCTCFPDSLQRTEMLCQQGCSFIANVADAKAEQELIQIVLLGSLDGVQQVIDALFLELIQRQQLFPCQRVDIRCGVHHVLLHQLGGNCCAKALDIHCIAGSKMDDIAQCLCRALGVNTAQSCFILQMNDWRTAGGADRGHLIGLCILCVIGNTDHFRDDITRLAHLNGIADAKAELMDKILIVQGRTGNGSTRQKDRVKAGRRGKNTSAANCDLNAAQRCLLYLWRILKRNCPAWEFVGGTHQIALCKIVHLDHCTIHIKIQFGTVLTDLLDLGNGLLNVMHDMIARRDRQAKALEVIQAFGMFGKRFAADLLHIENKDRKAPASGDFCILLAQRTGSRIARIFKGRCALQLLLCTQLLERAMRHIYLTAHFQKFRCILQLFGNAANGADIGGHVLAHHAIAAGRGTNQLTVFVF